MIFWRWVLWSNIKKINTHAWSFGSPNTFLMNQRPNTQRSAIIDERRLWTSPVPYLLDKDLGKHIFSCFIIINGQLREKKAATGRLWSHRLRAAQQHHMTWAELLKLLWSRELSEQKKHNLSIRCTYIVLSPYYTISIWKRWTLRASSWKL